MIKKVGSGAFGEIYKGTLNILNVIFNCLIIGLNLKTGEEVAIKLVSRFLFLLIQKCRNQQRLSIHNYTTKQSFTKYLMVQVHIV